MFLKIKICKFIFRGDIKEKQVLIENRNQDNKCSGPQSPTFDFQYNFKHIIQFVYKVEMLIFAVPSTDKHFLNED